MIVILKSFNGCDYDILTNSGKKTISLKGGGFMNEVSNDDWKLLTSQYKQHFEELIDNGFILVNYVNDSKAKNKQNVAVDNTLQDTKDKQEKKQKSIEKDNNIKIN